MIARIFLSGSKNISFGVQEHIFWGSSKYRLGYKHIFFGVQGSIFLNVVTRLSRRAESSRQVCWLQSARLLSLVASPFNRTTIPWFFPSFPFRASYLHSHPSEGYANLAILTSFLSHNQSVFKGLIIYFLSLFWLVPYLWMAMQRYGFFLEPPNFKMW